MKKGRMVSYINMNDDSSELSYDSISKKKIVDEVNSISSFEAARLCRIVRTRLEELDSHGNSKNEDEFYRGFREISRIGLREGVLPSALFLLYVMNLKN